MPASSDTLDPAIQSEDIGFRSEELISCTACRRQNAPNRIDCIYCGVELQARLETIDSIKLRKLESWEPGTTVVVNAGTGDVAKAAGMLSVERDQLEAIIAA